MLDLLLKQTLKKMSLRDVVTFLVAQVGMTDILGTVANMLRTVYAQKGRSAVIAMVTIRTVSIREWAKASKGDPDAAVEAWGRVASAFADFVQALLPKPKGG